MSSIPKVKPVCRIDPDTFNRVNPIKSVEVFHNGVIRVNRESLLQGDYSHLSNGRKGRKIKMLSQKSLAALVATIQATDIRLTTMLTLTYPKMHPNDGSIVKADLNRFLTGLRKKSPFEYLWFLEFQRRGAPHIHILTDHEAITPVMRIHLAEKWTGAIINSQWWLQRVALASVGRDCCEAKFLAAEVRKIFSFNIDPTVWEWVRSEDGAKRYVTKYATKPEQKEVPPNYQNVGRFWGCSRSIALGNGHRVETTEKEFRKFLRLQEHTVNEWEVIPKYLYDVKNIS